jgi:hypothetical protein
VPIREQRSVRKSLFLPGSKKYWNLKTEHARVLFIVLLTNADDFGRLEGSPEDVKTLIPRAPWPVEDIATYIQDLKRVELISHYRVGKQWYIEVQNFWQHQDKHGISQGPSEYPKPTNQVFAKHQSGVQEVDSGVSQTPQKRNNACMHDGRMDASLRKEGSGEETGKWSNFAQKWRSLGGGTAQATNMNKKLYTDVCEKYGEERVLTFLERWVEDQDDGFMRKKIAAWKFLSEGVHDVAEASEAGHGAGKKHLTKAEARDAHNAEVLERVLGKPE